MNVRSYILFALAGLAACSDRAPERTPEAPTAAPDPAPAEVAVAPAPPTRLVAIPAGTHRPMFPGKDEPAELSVPAFAIEAHAVTNAQFAAFVAARPEWRRSRVPRLFAEAGYLTHWAGDTVPGEGLADRPVTNVSWFAARAYARWHGRRLPSLAEWEVVAAASETARYGREDEGFTRRILDWYARPTQQRLPAVGSTYTNHYGVDDMHGLVWEWVEDFNTALVTGESRSDTGLDRNLFCGAGSIGSADPSDYAAFMRFAFRGSLSASYCGASLGFRCAADALPGETR